MTLHTRAADMLERYGRVDGVMHCEVSMLITELRAAGDAQPVAWRYRDYVSGCWFVSAEPYPAGSIAGESVPLYLAPVPAQQSALDELLRENERLGLYDDQATQCTRLIEVGPSFDALLTALDRASDKGYLPDAIAGEWEAFDYSPVHAAPAPAQPRQPVSDGELWSFLRSVMAQGIGIRADHTEYELFSARLDAAAAERVEQLRAITGDKP